MADTFGPNGLSGTGQWAYADGQLPSWATALNRFVSTTLVQVAIAGGAAGDHTVTGITERSILTAVIDLTTGADLTSEFTITAAHTINNAGGTDTTGEFLLVTFLRRSWT